jgi:hypothetical protein
MSFPEGPSPHETPRKLASGGGGRGLSRCSLPCGFRYRNLEISPLEAAKIGIFVMIDPPKMKGSPARIGISDN